MKPENIRMQYNANWVRQYLGVYAPEDLPIHPIIVVPGWTVRRLGNYKIGVTDADHLVADYLLEARRIYTPDQLKTVIQRLDDGCRSLEF